MGNKIKKTMLILLTAALTAALLSGCVSDTPDDSTAVNGSTYALVSKNVQNSYMQRLYQGFDAACREVGVSPVYKAPNSNDPQEQIEIIEELISMKVEGIAVAANDAAALTEVLQDAMENGISVVSVDSAVRSGARQTHIQQADPDRIGRTLVQAAYNELGGQGGIAILTSTEHATNQNLWIEYMKKEVEENPEKYASTPIVTIAYGDDDRVKSTTETQRLLANPQIKAIIAPTTVGIIAAGNVIRDNKSDVKLVGLGMPSQMSEFIEDDTCQRMYLWNPIDTGYLAAYTLSSLHKGQLTGASGESYSVGRLGERTITDDIEGGTEVMLGDLVEFNKETIGEWRNTF